MKYSDTYREQLLLDAVQSAENAAIQLRQYAAAVLETVQTVPGDAFSDNSSRRDHPRGLAGSLPSGDDAPAG